MSQSGDNAYKASRLKAIASLRDKGVDVYPHKFNISHTVENAKSLASKDLEENVNVSGRIVSIRTSGTKLVFYDIMAYTHQRTTIQVIAHKDSYRGKLFEEIVGVLRNGDIIGVIGETKKSKTGEPSIMASQIVPLSWCLHMLPDKNNLIDEEIRWRERHLDLIVNDDAIRVATIRSKIIQGIRRFFWDNDFSEVETPVLSLLAGGANALPFVTHMNALNLDMFLRIAPELALKQLVIGGMGKVFEIGKNYRNEGADKTHNPEFTAIEAYQIGADYYDLMEMTEKLLLGLSKIAGGQDGIVPYTTATGEEVMINFNGPYPRYPMIKTLEEKMKITFPKDLASEETRQWLDKILIEHNVECEFPRTTARMLDKLVGEFIEPLCVQPSFITDHPQLMCPLAKWHRDDPERLTERFELFVCGKELCNAYTELNDPMKQREGFILAAGDRDKGDSESMPTDEAFCKALEYGLHPTGGWGMGIDRLVMFLTNCKTIKDVILFPTMKPTEEELLVQGKILRK